MTKSIARPSAGRASTGPTTETSVPPARTSPADRFWISPLPSGQAGDRQAGTRCELHVTRERREVARLYCHIFRQGAVAIPVRQAEYTLSQRQAGGTIAES